jgi:hypothetical protein
MTISSIPMTISSIPMTISSIPMTISSIPMTISSIMMKYLFSFWGAKKNRKFVLSVLLVLFLGC